MPSDRAVLLHQSCCAACGEPVSVTDEGGCVGTDPGAYHFKAECLLEAVRREHAVAEALAQTLRLIRDTCPSSAASGMAAGALKRAGIEDPEDDCACF